MEYKESSWDVVQNEVNDETENEVDGKVLRFVWDEMWEEVEIGVSDEVLNIIFWQVRNQIEL